MVWSQESTAISERYNWLDAQVGPENTALFNGYLDTGDGFFEKNKSYKNTHRYYDAFDFFKGSITYNGEPYFELQIKYDLFNDQLLLNLEKSQGMFIPIQPIKKQVEGFNIDAHQFINLQKYAVNNADIMGFAEVLFNSTSLVLLKKHKKARQSIVAEDRLLYNYRSTNFNFIFYQGRFHVVNKRKDFIKVFPEFKREIRSYDLKKSSRDMDMIKLVEQLHIWIITKQPKI